MIDAKHTTGQGRSLGDESASLRRKIARACVAECPVGLETSRRRVTVYVTAVVLENDEVHFLEDIYGQDGAPDEELTETSVHSSPRKARVQ